MREVLRLASLARHPDGGAATKAVNDQARIERDIERLTRTFANPRLSLSRRLSAARVLRTRHGVPISQQKFLEEVRKAELRRLERRADRLPRQSEEFQQIAKDARDRRLHDEDKPGVDLGELTRKLGWQDIPLGPGMGTLKKQRDGGYKYEDDKTTRALAELVSNPRRTARSSAKTSVDVAGFLASPEKQLNVVRGVVEGTAAALGSSKGRSKTLKSIPATAAGIIPGLVAAATDPAGAAKAVADDFERRYGPAVEGDFERVREIARQEGALPYLLDIAAGGAVAGRAGMVAARGGMAGQRVRRAVTTPRPKLRTAPGRTKNQRTSRNAVVAAGQIALDSRRASAQRKRIEKGERGDGNLRPEDTRGREEGVVVPLTRTGARLARTRRFQDEQGRARLRMRREERDEITRGSRKSEASLSNPERRAFAYAVMGLVPLAGTRAQKLAALERREEHIKTARDDGGVEVKGRRREKHNDELRLIAYLKRHVDDAFTPNLARVVEVEKDRERRLAANDPALAAEQGELARIGPQARFLGVHRREGESEAAYHDRRVREAQRAVKQAQRKAEKARRAEAREEGKAQVLASTAERAMRHKRIGNEGGRRVDLTEQQGDRLIKVQANRRLAERELELARAELRAAKKREPIAASERGSEPIMDFIVRYEEARDRAGLPEPGYFKNEGGLFEPRRSDYALGTGYHGTTKGPRRRSYNAFDTGQIDTRMEVFHQGLAKNIKRKHQWNFVIDNLEDNAIQQLRDRDGNVVDLSEGRSLTELVHILDNSNIDPRSVEFVRVGKVRDEARKQDDSTTPEFDGDVERQVARAVDANSRSVAEAKREIITDPSQVKDDNGWFIVPKEIVKQMEAARIQTPVGRFIRKSVKGVPSKLLLGTNPSWAVLQVINNQTLALLGGVGPADMAKSAAFFRRLAKDDPELRKEIEAHLGATAFEAERHTAKMGATADWAWADYIREIKATPFAQAVGRHNPLDVLFKGDHAQTAFYRRAVAYDFLKGEAYRQMGESVTGFMTQMRRLKYSTSVGPERQMVELLKQPNVLEDMARHVDDLMGNYTRYSPWERRLLEQNVLFYGFLRFSVRFTLWTLPTKHPVKANLLATLSRLQEKETRKLLGVGEDDPLFPGTLSSFYYFKDGKLREVPLQRLNPAMNPLTAGNVIKSALLTLPPAFLAVFNQGSDKDFFTGKPHKIRGESQPRETRQNRKGYPGFDPAIFVEDAFLELLAPYKLTERLRFRDIPQGADSIPFVNERPTRFKDEDLIADIEGQDEDNRRRDVGLRALEALFPAPRPSRDDKLNQELADALDGKPSAPKTARERAEAFRKGERSRSGKSVRDRAQTYKNGGRSRRKSVAERAAAYK